MKILEIQSRGAGAIHGKINGKRATHRFEKTNEIHENCPHKIWYVQKQYRFKV